MIYHLLPEWEAFSAYRGGAISKNIANMMRFDSSRVVVCTSADDTWGYGAERILVLDGLRGYAKLKARRFWPVWLVGILLRRIFLPMLSALQAGDIVWCHSQPTFCAALAQSIHAKGARLVFHAHSSITPFEVCYKFQFFSADAVIFVSDALRKEALRRLPQLKNTFAIYNGADEAHFYPASNRLNRPAPPTILFVGRLHPDKGVHILMDAMRILEQRKVAALCKVVGSSFSGGTKASRYARNLIQSKPPNVQFEGYRIHTEVAQEYRNADVVCCPSIWQEPFGNINIEAMACEIPVVATRVGGIPEIAAEGGIILVEPNSAVELADALQRLIEDESLRKRIGVEGLKSFQQRFTWSSVYRQYKAIGDSLCSVAVTGER